MAIFNRLPKWPQVAAVYSVIVLVTYGWTLIWFFWKMPSWLYFLSIGEILKVLAYSITTNFFESLLVLCLPLGLSLLLSQKWFYERFVARSVVTVVIGLGYMMYLANQFQGKEDYPALALLLAPVIVLLIVLAVFLVGKITFVGQLVADFADRATVFLYFSIPLSLVCLLVVLVQLVF